MHWINFIYFQAVSNNIVKTKVIKLSSKQLEIFPNFYENSHHSKYWEGKSKKVDTT